MSIKLRCILCLKPSTEYEGIQSEKGEFNDIYEIIVKYFDPMLLTEADNFGKNNQVLCHECWMPIKDFSEFQQNVLSMRSLLEKTEVNLLTVVKLENDGERKENANHEKYDHNYNSHNMDVDDCEKSKYAYEFVFKPDLDIKADINDEWSTCVDDEKPLIALKNKTLSKTEILPQEKHEEIATIGESRKPKPRGRKPKIIKSKDIDKQKKKVKLSDDSDAFIAEWKPVLECDLCEETSPNFGKLRSHFQEKHKTRIYIKCCERKFYRRHLLVNHIHLHLNPEIHKCEICGKVSTCKNNLKIHKKLMHEEAKKLECEFCHKIFNQKPYLDRHLLTHAKGEKNFSCQQCDKAYVFEVQLKSHIKTVHNVDRVCDQCGKTIHGARAMKNHLMAHAGIKKSKFSCDECGVELNSRSSLKRHKATLHHDGSTIYVCSICGKIASSANALLNHKKQVHVKERKFKCTYCDKAFKTSKVLREHIATHTGQDLYQCPHCTQTFKVSANMHHHRKKVHPLEWEKSRKNRLQAPKVDINQVKNQTVL